MKSLLLIFISILGCSNLFTQEHYKTIKMFANEPDKYSIYVGKEKTWIDLKSKDIMSKRVGFYLEDYEIPRFKRELNTALEKLKEWKQVAIENNITDFSKEIKASEKGGFKGFFYFGDSFQLVRNFDFTYTFMVCEILDQTYYVVDLRTGKLTGNSNKLMEIKGGDLTFVSVEELQAFIDSFDIKKIQEFRSKIKDTDDLFKDDKPQENKESLFKD